MAHPTKSLAGRFDTDAHVRACQFDIRPDIPSSADHGAGESVALERGDPSTGVKSPASADLVSVTENGDFAPLAPTERRRPASIADLAPELIALIVKNLVHNRRALRACALVGTQFLGPCREVLFRTLRLGSKHFHENTKNTLDVISSISTIGRSLVSLTIYARVNRTLDPADFLKVLIHMPRLHTVILDGALLNPEGDTTLTQLTSSWEHPHLRLLRIVLDTEITDRAIIHTIIFFRRVPINVLELHRGDMTACHQADNLLLVQHSSTTPEWPVDTLSVDDDMWGSLLRSKDLQKVLQGLLQERVTDTIQLHGWGLSFMRSLIDIKDLHVEHMRLVASARNRDHEYWEPDDWKVYGLATSLQSITFVFHAHGILQRFHIILANILLNLPPTFMRTIAFEIHLSRKCPTQPDNILNIWGRKMRWSELVQALRRFTSLDAVQFGIVADTHIGSQTLAKCHRDMRAIVRQGLPELVAGDRVRFVEENN